MIAYSFFLVLGLSIALTMQALNNTFSISDSDLSIDVNQRYTIEYNELTKPIHSFRALIYRQKKTNKIVKNNIKKDHQKLRS